jgi:ferrous iron transport protein A
MNAVATPRTASAARDATTLVGLGGLRPGAVAEIGEVEDHGAASRRLMALGFVPGTTVQIVRVAPLLDPIEVEVRGTRFGLRRAEANWIRVVRP